MRLKFLDYRTKSALKQNHAVRTTIPYSAAKEIGILFTVEDKMKHQQVKEFIAKLNADGKSVKVLEFLPKKKENPEFMFDFFTVEDLNFWGRINSTSVDKFCKINFDYLINIDIQSNPLITNLLANCKAMCRVGRYEDRSAPYFEFMIETNGSTKGLIDSIYSYIQQLR